MTEVKEKPQEAVGYGKRGCTDAYTAIVCDRDVQAGQLLFTDEMGVCTRGLLLFRTSCQTQSTQVACLMATIPMTRR